jgi:hypothetical protein
VQKRLLTTIEVLAIAGSAWCYGCSGGDTGSVNGGTGGSSGTAGSGGTGGNTSQGGSTSGGASSGGASTGGTASGGASSGGSGAIGGSTSSGGAAGGSQCSGDTSFFSTVDKTCASAGDCVLVRHTTSCCGSELVMAINSSAQAQFNSVEAYCDSLLPACGCACQQCTSAEDGTLFAADPASIIADCTNGTCNSRYNGVTFDCAGNPCTEEQYCTIWSGGPAGSEPVGNCNQLASCTDCSCVGSSPGCTCSVQDTHITVSCFAP